MRTFLESFVNPTHRAVYFGIALGLFFGGIAAQASFPFFCGSVLFTLGFLRLLWVSL